MNTVITHTDGRRELGELPAVTGYDLYHLLDRCGCPVHLDRRGRLVLPAHAYYRWYLLIHAYNRVDERIRAVDRVDARFAQELRDIRGEMIWEGDMCGWLTLANIRLQEWESEHLARLTERWV